jgi:uncharacterized protein (TIGR02246 family)
VLAHDDAVELFHRRRDAWLAEDLNGYLDLFDDDVVLQTPVGAPVRGREEYGALVRRAYRATRPVAFDFHTIAVDGDRVLAEWTIELEVRADGRRIRYRGMSTCRVRDRRIIEWREYYDPADLRPAGPGGDGPARGR